MHDPANVLRRIPLPRTPVNKGKKKGRGCYTPALKRAKRYYSSRPRRLYCVPAVAEAVAVGLAVDAHSG
jgi:hypothetical protein